MCSLTGLQSVLGRLAQEVVFVNPSTGWTELVNVRDEEVVASLRRRGFVTLDERWADERHEPVVHDFSQAGGGE